MSCPIITLTTDFGSRDPYVAEMKAVILSIYPNARIVDISHEIEKFNIRAGAFVLASASPYFPKGSIHVAVVDPSVGTKRRGLLVQTRNGFYIGPDSGVLALSANRQGTEHIYEITNPKFMMPKISSTFHGRDVFAPAAAHLASGIKPTEFGKELDKMISPNFARTIKRKDRLAGEVLYIDSFGNIMTNIAKEDIESIDIGENVSIKLGNFKTKLKLCKTYVEARKNRPLALIGSHSFLEISVNQGNASRTFKIRNGDRVTLYRS
jgi:S-adenosylmethionine hydrolase